MGRGRKTLALAAASGPKERHKRAQKSQYDHLAPVPEGFVAKLPVPKSKHHSYFEFVENKEKKRKLEFQITTKKTPPPGFEFVPVGNPQLTSACKELSREKDAMIFIVSNARNNDLNQFAHQVHRVGHHIRQAIVEAAKEGIVNLPQHVATTLDGEPEPIPESRPVYHAQVNAAIRDLFPRIPNTDRQMIIEHAFTRGSTHKPDKPVGLVEDITLARRVQLAVLAHIRHTHTRYDELLRETTWQNARKVVEALCLDILVKWRGDEESGRDQLDEILREVVVISDSEDEASEEELTDGSSVEDAGHSADVSMPDCQPAQGPPQGDRRERDDSPRLASRSNHPFASSCSNKSSSRATDLDSTANRKAQRGFKRYRAWEEAIRRNREETTLPQHRSMDNAAGHRLYQQRTSAVTPYEMPNRFHDGSDLGIHPRAPGSAPNLNGYVPQQRPVYGSPPWNSTSYAIPKEHVPHKKVMSTVNGQPSGAATSQQPVSPGAKSMQDMLVQSIEQASPNAQPSFVRTLPPRSLDQMDSHSPRFGTQRCPPGPVMNLGKRIYIEDRTYLSRGVIGNRPSRKHSSWLGTFSNEEAAHLSTPRDLHHSHSVNPGMPTASPLSIPATRAHGSSASSEILRTRRILVNAPRPGERSNPILMEDRGGFYERISIRPEEAIRAQLQGTRVIEPLPPSQDFRRTLEPHGVVSWEEGARILKESQGTGVETIPMPCLRARSSTAYPHTSHECLDPPSYDIRAGRPPQQGFREVLSSDSRPMSGAEYGAPPPGGYWVVQRHDGRPIAPQQHHQPRCRPPFEGHPEIDEQYDASREHCRPPQTPPNVIILD